MPRYDPKMKPIVFYGVAYISRGACMAINGIKSYTELAMHIEREKNGLPFVRPKTPNNSSASGERNRRRYFEKKLKAEGFIKK